MWRDIDSEIGFPVSAPVTRESITSHTLREMHFYSRRHDGPVATLRTTAGTLYDYMNTTGLSPELELVEVYRDHRPGAPLGGRVDVMTSFLAWPEVYRAQLERVLDRDTAAAVWAGGEKMTPHTPVDPRCDWVAASIDRLKKHSTPDQQFDILSRVALVRPPEEIQHFKTIYDETGDRSTPSSAPRRPSSPATRTGGFVDPPRVDGTTLHISKVPYNREAYAQGDHAAREAQGLLLLQSHPRGRGPEGRPHLLLPRGRVGASVLGADPRRRVHQLHHHPLDSQGRRLLRLGLPSPENARWCLTSHDCTASLMRDC